MNPVFAARIELVKAESSWRKVDRDTNATMEQRTEARLAYELAKSNYRKAFKLQSEYKPTGS